MRTRKLYKYRAVSTISPEKLGNSRVTQHVIELVMPHQFTFSAGESTQQHMTLSARIWNQCVLLEWLGLARVLAACKSSWWKMAAFIVVWIIDIWMKTPKPMFIQQDSQVHSWCTRLSCWHSDLHHHRLHIRALADPYLWGRHWENNFFTSKLTIQVCVNALGLSALKLAIYGPHLPWTLHMNVFNETLGMVFYKGMGRVTQYYHTVVEPCY